MRKKTEADEKIRLCAVFKRNRCPFSLLFAFLFACAEVIG